MHITLPVFLLGMMVQWCNDSKLEGKDFPWQSFVHISSIDTHHSSVLRFQIKESISNQLNPRVYNSLCMCVGAELNYFFGKANI